MMTLNKCSRTASADFDVMPTNELELNGKSKIIYIL